jgi:rhodanese-related sulfurtransferase
MPTEVNRTEVRRLVEAGAQLLDVLPREEYEQEHLPGAVNIPLKELDRLAAARLALDVLVLPNRVTRVDLGAASLGREIDQMVRMAAPALPARRGHGGGRLRDQGDRVVGRDKAINLIASGRG